MENLSQSNKIIEKGIDRKSRYVQTYLSQVAFRLKYWHKQRIYRKLNKNMET